MTVALAALMVAPTASAHVTLQPKEVPAGGFVRLNVRVPNERDNAGTTKVAVKFPPGFYFASYEPVDGWNVTVAKRELKKAVEEHGEKITEEIDQITWTGSGQAGVISPGQFRDFGVSLGTPDEAGTTLTFKATQTYSNGEVVRWIGKPDAEQPAPQVELLAAEEEHGAAKPEEAEEPEEAAAPEETADDGDEEEDDGDGLGLIALIVGGLALFVGIAALVRGRGGSA